MAFRFALAPLLRLRRSLERQRALALQQASLNVIKAQKTLAQLETFIEESAKTDARSLASGRSAAELHFAFLLRERLQQLRVHLQGEIQRLEMVREQAAGVYEQALHEREALEALEARRRREYQIEQARRQQQEIDAAFLLQRWRIRED